MVNQKCSARNLKREMKRKGIQEMMVVEIETIKVKAVSFKKTETYLIFLSDQTIQKLKCSF